MTPEERADAVMDAFYKADLASGARTVLLTLITEAVRAAENEALSRASVIPFGFLGHPGFSTSLCDVMAMDIIALKHAP